MRYRYLIWHFDGALFDTAEALSRATASALAHFGITPAPETLAALLAESGGAAGAHAARHYALPLADFQAEWEARYRAILLRDQPPQPGAVALCRCVAESGGRNYLYAARSHGDVDRFLAAFGMTPLFTGWLTLDGAGTPPAVPDYRLLLSGCGLQEAAALLITDRRADVQRAQAAGLASCFFGAAAPAGAVTAYDALIGDVCAAGEVVS
ncbi:MAG: HAD hydrolase-like protein [Anaerolineae bacterium]|nr:HAD hydrolase-like protein [Anaerolineae bacterium]